MSTARGMSWTSMVTFAMAFDYGTANLQSHYDARFPLVIGNARINDYHAKRAVSSSPRAATTCR